MLVRRLGLVNFHETVVLISRMIRCLDVFLVPYDAGWRQSETQARTSLPVLLLFVSGGILRELLF